MSRRQRRWLVIGLGGVILLLVGVVALQVVIVPLLLPTPMPTPTTPPTPTPDSGGAGVIKSFLRAPGDVSQQDLQNAASILATRLDVLEIPRAQVHADPPDLVLVEMPITPSLDVGVDSFRQPGEIAFIHIGAQTGPSYRLSLMGQAVDLGQFDVPLRGDIFAAAYVELDQMDAWRIRFDLKPEAAAVYEDLAANTPGSYLGVVVDGEVLTVIDVGDQTIPGRERNEARLVAAFMASGPLTIPLDHFMNDYPTLTPPPEPTAPTG